MMLLAGGCLPPRLPDIPELSEFTAQPSPQRSLASSGSKETKSSEAGGGPKVPLPADLASLSRVYGGLEASLGSCTLCLAAISLSYCPSLHRST